MIFGCIEFGSWNSQIWVLSLYFTGHETHKSEFFPETYKHSLELVLKLTNLSSFTIFYSSWGDPTARPVMEIFIQSESGKCSNFMTWRYWTGECGSTGTSVESVDSSLCERLRIRPSEMTPFEFWEIKKRTKIWSQNQWKLFYSKKYFPLILRPNA